MDILEIKNVTYNYSNSKEKILSSVNQKFELGQFYAIIGKSGAGKSTLLSLLAGLDKPQKGQILFKNEDIENKGYSNHRKNNIALVFQNYNLLNSLTIYENIMIPLKLIGEDKKVIDEKVHQITKELDIESLLNKYPHECSGGQQQRVALARTLAQKPEIILADEPVAALDPITATQVMDDFKKINKELNMSVLINIHHVDLALKYADRVIGIKAGEIVYDGAAKDVTNEVLKQIYGRELAADEVMGA